MKTMQKLFLSRQERQLLKLQRFNTILEPKAKSKAKGKKKIMSQDIELNFLQDCVDN